MRIALFWATVLFSRFANHQTLGGKKSFTNYTASHPRKLWSSWSRGQKPSVPYIFCVFYS